MNLWRRYSVTLIAILFALNGRAEGLNAAGLGVLYNLDDAGSRQVALHYAAERAVPAGNVIGLRLPRIDMISPEYFAPIRAQVLDKLPTGVQSLLLVWSKPYAVGCMSITSAFAFGYRVNSCLPGCVRTIPNPLFDATGWLPADTVAWWPSMLLPSDDVALAYDVIRRGIAADSSAPPGTLYLVRTPDRARSVRALTYRDIERFLSTRIRIQELSSPSERDLPDALGYFTGAPRVGELAHIRFRSGALADHLTSTGGVLDGWHQMPAIAWLKQGATASYGSVSEPCSYLEKFPNVGVLFEHYLHGETALESYWKSVAMPSQGLFIGEPLSRPFAARSP